MLDCEEPIIKKCFLNHTVLTDKTFCHCGQMLYAVRKPEPNGILLVKRSAIE